MKPPKSFSPLNTLKTAIHPPLPLNQRQSGQLLNLLKTSFRHQLAASAVNPNAPTDAISPVLSHHSPDVHLEEILKRAPFTKNESDIDPSKRLERFMSAPLESYRELLANGVPSSAGLAAFVLKRHTAKVLKQPEEEWGKDWAVAAVMEVLRPLWRTSPRIHIENRPLRIQVVQTLVRGGNCDVAVNMLNKDWLLRVPRDQTGTDALLVLRSNLTKDILFGVEEVLGMDAAAEQFLNMVDMWKGNGGDSLDDMSIRQEISRMLPKAALLVESKRHGKHPNPFASSAQHFLTHYATRKSPDILPLRQRIYQVCKPWLRNRLVEVKLVYYYEDNPYPLYNHVKALNERLTSDQVLRQLVGTSFDLIQALVVRNELEKAAEIVGYLRCQAGEVPGLDLEMVLVIEDLLRSKRKADIDQGLAEILSSLEKLINPPNIFLKKYGEI